MSKKKTSPAFSVHKGMHTNLYIFIYFILFIWLNNKIWTNTNNKGRLSSQGELKARECTIVKDAALPTQQAFLQSKHNTYKNK